MEYIRDVPHQKIKGGEKHICPECFHYRVCVGRANRSCIECDCFVPAADVREVVLCGECYLHTHCRTEDVFDFAGLREENRFCSVGKRKTNGAKMEVQDG